MGEKNDRGVVLVGIALVSLLTGFNVLLDWAVPEIKVERPSVDETSCATVAFATEAGGLISMKKWADKAKYLDVVIPAGADRLTLMPCSKPENPETTR